MTEFNHETEQVCICAQQQAARDMPYVEVGVARRYQYHEASQRWYVEVDLQQATRIRARPSRSIGYGVLLTASLLSRKTSEKVMSNPHGNHGVCTESRGQPLAR